MQNIEGLAREALARNVCLRVRSRSASYIVEVHAVGTTEDGEKALRVWQICDLGEADEYGSGWKLLPFSQIESCEIIDRQSLAPRLGYRHVDPEMPTVILRY